MTAHRALAPAIMHGGRLDAARRLYPNAPQPWVDLSTGVNPHAFPVSAIEARAWTRLPDDDAFAALELVARSAYRAPRDAEIVIGAGAQTIIQVMPRAFPPRRVAVLGFTYAEHAACWEAAGAAVQTVETLNELGGAEAAVIVNPNNPDGRLVSCEDIAALAEKLSRKGGLLVVDESFMDFTPTQSVAALASRAPLIVLRSIGKSYGLAGLRLGVAICAQSIASPLRAALGPWPVSGPALAVGARALADDRWLRAAADACAIDAARLDKILELAGFSPHGGTSLFRLVAHHEAAHWFARLCENGILTRCFPQRPELLRFGLPGAEPDWRRLEDALEISDG